MGPPPIGRVTTVGRLASIAVVETIVVVYVVVLANKDRQLERQTRYWSEQLSAEASVSLVHLLAITNLLGRFARLHCTLHCNWDRQSSSGNRTKEAVQGSGI